MGDYLVSQFAKGGFPPLAQLKGLVLLFKTIPLIGRVLRTLFYTARKGRCLFTTVGVHILQHIGYRRFYVLSVLSRNIVKPE